MNPGETKPKPRATVRKTAAAKAKPAGPATLVISEKQIAAQRIAEILSEGRATAGGGGRIPIYRFPGDGREFRVVGLSGHVVEVDYPSALNRWHAVNPRDLVFAEPIKKVPRDSKPILESLQKAAAGVDEIIVATDFDREGELIGLEGIDLVKDVAPSATVRRARFSSLTAREVRDAFAHPVDLDRNLAAAGESRQYVDLAWGAVLTRIITMSARTGGREVLSVGRVQSPTLALIVDLEKRIRAFKTTPYWVITARCGDPPFEARHLGPSLKAAAAPESADAPGETDDEEEPAIPAHAFADPAEAQRVYASIKDAKEAAVEALQHNPRTEPAPTPFNTTAFLQAAAGLGAGAARAMSLAEELYMRGYISYPRTDNTVYPPTEDLDAIIRSLAEAGPFGADVAYLATVRRAEPTRGKKTATDHPPIHPVEAAKRSDLPEDAWRIYELVVRRFLATLARDATGDNVRVDLRIKTEPFRANGYRIGFWGWKKLYPYSGAEDRPLPEMREGDRIPVHEVKLDGKETQPPKRYGQGRLIAEMERLGLGTKSTRHDIIEKLLQRHYVQGQKSLEPTDIGFAVTDALERYAELIAKPNMTAQLEDEMELVAEGKKKLAEVVEDSRRLLEGAVTVLEKNRDQLSRDLTAALAVHSSLGPCPACGKAMNVLTSRAGKRFVGCTGYPACRQTYPLPQMGRLVPVRQPCPACRAPLVRILTKGRPPWELCANMECPSRGDRAPPAAAPAAAEGSK